MQGTQEMKPAAEQTPQIDQCMGAKPQAEHEWLHKLVGTWEGEGEALMAPDQPPMKWKTTETVRSIGGMWVVAEGNGDMPGGGTATTIMTLGFDPQKGRFVGSFIGSMMANMWVYEGSLDAGKSVLTLDTEGPCGPASGNSKFKDIIEFKSDDLRTLTSVMQGPDGEWRQVVIATYRRKS